MSAFIRFFTGIGLIGEGLVMVLCLGLKNNPNFHYKTGGFAHKIEYGIKRYRWRREYHRSTFRIAPEGGIYRTSDDRCVLVKPNVTGWFDGLAFTVHPKRGIEFHPDPCWTVDERGWAWPPRLDKVPAKTDMDIVEKYK